MLNQALILRPNTLPALADSFDAYASAIAELPTLSAEEEYRLARQLIDHQDLAAAQTLVLTHLKFVVHIARSFSGYGLALSDLVQEGNVGLMKAVKRFDPDRGVRLVSFAVHWIKSEIHDFIIKNWRIVKIATTKAQRKLFFNLRSAKRHLGWLNVEESQAIAEDLGVPVEEVVRMEGRLASSDVAFDTSPSLDDESSYRPENYIEDEGANPLDQLEAIDSFDQSQIALRNALQSLDVRSRDILNRRWLVENEADKPTLHTLAEEYSVSAERIRQIEVAALKKLKGLIEKAF